MVLREKPHCVRQYRSVGAGRDVGVNERCRPIGQLWPDDREPVTQPPSRLIGGQLVRIHRMYEKHVLTQGHRRSLGTCA